MDRESFDESTASRIGLQRPSRIFSERVEAAAPLRVARVSGPAIWALSGWIGLVCGLLECGIQCIWRRFEHQLASPDLWVSWHEPWMAPLSLAIGFVGLGLVLGLSRGIAPRITARGIPRILVGLGCWSLLGVVPGIHPWVRNAVAVVAAIRIGSLARFDSASFRQFARAGFPALAGVWVTIFIVTGVWPLVAESWALRVAPKPAKGATNVLLVVLDTVRADNLSLHGYSRPTTPG